MSEVKFPEITIKLVGQDGNAFSIIGRVKSAMRKAKIPNEDIKSYQDEAMSGDYNNVIAITMKTVNVE